ncbi:MAG: hypothetical protein JSU70_03445, partial [Phycisphaerales bacterium]
MKKSRIVITVVIVVAFVALSVAGFFVRRKMTTAAGKAVTVRIESAKRGQLIEFVSAPGEIEPTTKVEISAKISARVTELPYEEGDTVTCGDPKADPPVPPSLLVRLDSKDLESRLLSAQASRAAQAAQIEVEKARIAGQRSNLVGLAASLQQAERDLERQRSLYESQDVSQTSLDQAK